MTSIQLQTFFLKHCPTNSSVLWNGIQTVNWEINPSIVRQGDRSDGLILMSRSRPGNSSRCSWHQFLVFSLMLILFSVTFEIRNCHTNVNLYNCWQRIWTHACHWGVSTELSSHTLAAFLINWSRIYGTSDENGRVHMLT
jgi:hypothetical protein